LTNQQASFLPFLVPIPALLGDRLKEAATGAELRRSQLKGLHLALLCFVFSLLLQHSAAPLMHFFAPGAAVAAGQPPPNPFTIGTTAEIPNALKLPVELYALVHEPMPLLKRWLATLTLLGLWFIWQVNLFGVSVAACRMLGVDVVAPVYDLLGAKSLYQFFERYNPYYCRTILELYVYPIFRVTKRMNLSFALGIFICGFVTHHLILVYFALLNPQAPYPRGYPTLTFYWVVMAVVTGLSFALERRRGAPARGFSIWRVPIYFVVTAVLFLFIVDYYTDSLGLGDRVRFFLSLF
jgi:hypothetical protein